MRLFSGSTATLAPMKPILMSGLIALIISAVFTSDLKEGVEVCITTRSAAFDLRRDVLESQAVRRGIDQLRASTSAAGCASQVGYQNERTSRFI